MGLNEEVRTGFDRCEHVGGVYAVRERKKVALVKESG